MNILVVGALSWNPERLRSLCERGHRLWGRWSRTMAWEQGPYKATDGCVRTIDLISDPGSVAERIRWEPKGPPGFLRLGTIPPAAPRSFKVKVRSALLSRRAKRIDRLVSVRSVS